MAGLLPELNGFANMRVTNLFGTRQVGNGAGNAQQPVISACG